MSHPRAALRRIRLDSGLVVIARENRATRSVALRVTLRAGAAFDPPGKAGTAALVAELLDRGAGGMSARAIAERQEFLGASYVAPPTNSPVARKCSSE